MSARSPMSPDALRARRLKMRTCACCGEVETQAGTLIQRREFWEPRVTDFPAPVISELVRYPRVCRSCYDRICRAHHLAPVREVLWERPQTVAVIDLETTGLDFDAQITEIGVCALDGTPLFGSLVEPDPKVRWDKEAIILTGLSPRVLRGMPRRREVLVELLATLADHGVDVLAGWGDCDRRWLSYQLEEEAIEPPPSLRFMDLKQVYSHVGVESLPAAPLLGRWWETKRVSLAEACRTWHVWNRREHRALTDAQAAAAVTRAILPRWPVAELIRRPLERGAA